MEKKEKDSGQRKKEQLNSYIKYSGLGIQMIVMIVLGAWAGMKLDEYFEVKSHLFTIFLLVFSVIASIYYVIRGLLK